MSFFLLAYAILHCTKHEQMIQLGDLIQLFSKEKIRRTSLLSPLFLHQQSGDTKPHPIKGCWEYYASVRAMATEGAIALTMPFTS